MLTPDDTRNADEVAAAARAFVLNARNRGIHQRARDYAGRVGATSGDASAAVAYVAEGHLLAEARREVIQLARSWTSVLPGPPKRILDAGCGPGAVTTALAEMYPEADVLGVDVEDEALTLGRALACRHARFERLELEHLSAADHGHFDLILCREVIEHVYQPRSAIARLLQVLAPGGVLYLEAPNYRFPWEPHVRLPIAPHGPHWLVELACRVLGRDAEFTRHLNLNISTPRVKGWLRECDARVEIRDLMAEKVVRLLAPEPTEASAVPARERLLALLRRHRALRDAARLVLVDLSLAPSVALLVHRPA